MGELEAAPVGSISLKSELGSETSPVRESSWKKINIVRDV